MLPCWRYSHILQQAFPAGPFVRRAWNRHRCFTAFCNHRWPAVPACGPRFRVSVVPADQEVESGRIRPKGAAPHGAAPFVWEPSPVDFSPTREIPEQIVIHDYGSDYPGADTMVFHLYREQIMAT